LEKACAQTIYTLLQQLGISYESTTHAPALTMEDLTGVEQQLQAQFCKNLFLCNRQKTEFFLLLIREDKRFRTAEVSKKIGRSRLSFGGEEDLYEMLGVHPGAITPMGLIFDEQKRINLLIDADLQKLDRICVHPCVNTESLVMSTEDLFHRFLQHTGHVPQYIEITGEVEG